MKTIIFDFDGTLLDSRFRHEVVLREIIVSEYGSKEKLNIDDYVLYKSAGNNTVNYLTKIHNISQEDAVNIAKEWQNRIENKEYLQYDVLYFDTIETLNFLKRKYSLVLLSARQSRESLIQQLKDSEIIEYFVKIGCVNPKKALIEKEVFLQGCRNIILSIGDTEVDYNAAKLNNIMFYPLNRGFRNKEYWDLLGISSYKDLHEIYSFLENKNIGVKI
jgi:phosphoglycolate phosphatase